MGTRALGTSPAGQTRSRRPCGSGRRTASRKDHSDIDRELREHLGADGYDAKLYATRQNNRVSLERVKDDSLAERAGLGDCSVVWSYDGQRILRTTERPSHKAKNRLALPEELPLEWAAYAKYFAGGYGPQEVTGGDGEGKD